MEGALRRSASASGQDGLGQAVPVWEQGQLSGGAEEEGGSWRSRESANGLLSCLLVD